MKKLIFLSAALVACGVSLAQDVGRVISTTPIIQQVGQPRNVCTTEQVFVQPQKSGAGALLGAIAGGAMGNAIGGGAGTAAATVIGLMGGAIVGDSIEGAPMAHVQNVQRCGVQTFYENRTVAYNVLYEYAGKQYSVQMPNDPGPTIQLSVSPVGFNVQAAPSNTPVYSQTVSPPPPTAIVVSQAYPVYERRSYYPPISMNFGFGSWGGGHGSRGGHWR